MIMSIEKLMNAIKSSDLSKVEKYHVKYKMDMNIVDEVYHIHYFVILVYNRIMKHYFIKLRKKILQIILLKSA